MHPLLRSILMTLPGGKRYIRLHARSEAHRRFSLAGNTKEVFLKHFEVNSWGCDESVSGEGSTLQYTENIRRMIPEVIKELGVKNVLDAPCGDFNWFRMIEWRTRITYLGGDIVAPLVERNQALYGNDTTMFICLDIVNDILPKADLWLCRDCLFHLSERDIFLVLNNFIKSDIDYLITSTHPNCNLNTDIPTGSYRLLNLQLPPYRLSNPNRVIDDWIEGYPVRKLAIWTRETVKNDLASNKDFQRTIRNHL